MVHVAMRDADDIAGQRKMRRAPHVKADVQFGNLRHGFLAGHAAQSG